MWLRGHTRTRPARRALGYRYIATPCQRSTGAARSKARIFCGNAETVDEQLKGATFDKIFCSEVLEHVQHPERTLRAMANLSASGGKLIISVPNERLIDTVKTALAAIGLFRFVLGSSVARSMRDDWHLHLFERKTLPQLLSSSGIIAKRSMVFPSTFCCWLCHRRAESVEEAFYSTYIITCSAGKRSVVNLHRGAPVKAIASRTRTPGLPRTTNHRKTHILLARRHIPALLSAFTP